MELVNPFSSKFHRKCHMFALVNKVLEMKPEEEDSFVLASDYLNCTSLNQNSLIVDKV
ncbi:hypothetical protein Bhyg_14835 [Pseudolycoriella hygida]|uniref:Uncharacterized protein n=1 Tax=Pseudolycoriella hygida TaxID=35572 RepID=A0A9Q0MTU1_9DIPT|nr:hypothetical protein Bhyg_14835 [Pseudolycoriella hygida]